MATTNGSFSQQDTYKSTPENYATASTAAEPSSATNGTGDLSKDEIGWYFVEQYYTTLSRWPEKLHLFYNKRSQFVSGLEAVLSDVSVGRMAIQERIKTLDFQDCKVRVSNVDSQASDENIVIQVIGETSNKSAELKKFVQTFVLAQQPTGYFVLNDIFRYIKEDEQEDVDPMSSADDGGETNQQDHLIDDVEMPAGHIVTEEEKSSELDVEVVSQKLEENLETVPAVIDDSVANGDVEESVAEEVKEGPAAAKSDETAPSLEEVGKSIEEEEIKEPEEPKEPEPTPSISRVPSAPKTLVEQPAAPPKPMSWANRAAAAAAAATATPRPIIPMPKISTSPAPAQQRAPAAPQPTTPSQPTTVTPLKENEPPQSQGSGWVTAGSDHAKRQNRPQSVSVPPEKEGTMGYVRNVTEAVKTEDLRATLSSFGELIYFDINRQKNCAFVEYATTAGYQAAYEANPHKLAGESIIVEPRRPKSSAYGGSSYVANRGALNGRGRGFDQGRPGNQRGRGDFNTNRGRGAPRGRGSSQPANA